MTATLDAPPSGPPEDRPIPSARRRRDTPQHGMLMTRAFKLRDQVPKGRRRAETSRARSWAQIAIGLLVASLGVTIIYSTGPAWTWAGAVAAGLGPVTAMLGVIDLARRGADGELRVERICRTIRIFGAALTMLLIGLEVLTALVAVALLVSAVVLGSWSDEVVYFLSNALVFATMAGGIMMMVRVADLRPIPLTRVSWWRELGTFRQLTSIAVPVAVVGSTVALSLRDTRAVALAMIGLATVLVGWFRGDRAATDDAVRRLAEATDDLAASVRPIVAKAEVAKAEQEAASRRTASDASSAVVGALDRLELACHRNMRRGIPAGPRYLVDAELIAVVRASRAALVYLPIEHLGSALTVGVTRELAAMEPYVFAREFLIFAGDVRRLATLAPDRLVAL